MTSDPPPMRERLRQSTFCQSVKILKNFLTENDNRAEWG